MNYEIIVYIMGWILNMEAVFMLLPCIVAVIYHEPSGMAFVITAVISLVLGLLITRKKPTNNVFYAAEGFVTVSFSWILLSVVGAAPFVIGGYIPNPVDALFETVSGFTTTGASILTDVEALSKCMLFWRSFTHWVGGMGVLVFLLCLLPMVGASHMNLMKAESPGPSVTRMLPKVQVTAKVLYTIYFGLTVLEFIFLWIGGMPLFDAICTAMGTAGTGGFGIWNSSIGGYAIHLQVIVTIFMILFGVNFSFYFLVLTKKIGNAFKIEEVRWYFAIIAIATIVISFNILHLYDGNFLLALNSASFQVGSIITTTGFSTADFDMWPELSKTILVVLMFCGACAGSTGGGFKVSRIVILVKTIKKELKQYLHPRQVGKVRMDGKVVEHEVVRSINVYMIIYVLIFMASLILITFDNFDFTTNFTAVTATFNNIGPGLNLVGPTQNFSIFSNFSKLILTFDMLAGRLEIFPLVLIFHPGTWKRL